MDERTIGDPGANGARISGGLSRIFSVTPGKAWEFDILSRKVCGVWTHWIDKRSLPCNSPEQGHCRFDHRPPTGGRRWQGWLSVRHKQTGQVGWVSFNAGGLKGCKDLREMKTLRGAVLRCWRAGKEINSKLMVAVGIPDTIDGSLPSALDPGAFLCRLWDIPGNIIPFGVEGMPPEVWPEIAHLEIPNGENPLEGTVWEGKDLDLKQPGTLPVPSKEALKRLRKAGNS